MNNIIDAPAPWQLTGRAYLCVLKPDPKLLDEHSWVPASLAGKRRSGVSLMMFVDYANSPAGPYHELLFIPGQFAFEDGQKRFSISRIFVSTMDSVVNGQRNWGIPKQLANFTVSDDHNTTRVALSTNDKTFAELTFEAFGPNLPVPRGLLPKAWRTLAQHWQDQTFVYQPNAGGKARLARTRELHFDASEFPALQRSNVLATFNLSSFNMTFPVAQIYPQGDMPR